MELQVSLEFNFDVLHLSTDTYTQQQGIAGVFFPEKLTEQFKVPLGEKRKETGFDGPDVFVRNGDGNSWGNALHR